MQVDQQSYIRKQPTNKQPLVRDCWYDVPYVWLEIVLRIITLMGILVILLILIHFTVGQLSTLKTFSTFLEHAHLITDASELGIMGKASKEDGLLYSPQDEKDEGDLNGIQSSHVRNTSLLSDLPVEIYKGMDDDNAYFITFREMCDDKTLADEATGDDVGVTPALKIPFMMSDHSSKQALSNIQGFYGLSQNYQNDPQPYGERNLINVDNPKMLEASQSNIGIDLSVIDNSKNEDTNLVVGNGLMRQQTNFNDRRDVIKESTALDVEKPVQGSNLHVDSVGTNFDSFMHMREGVENMNANQNSRLNKANQQESVDDQSRQDSLLETTNDDFQMKPIPKLKLVLNEHHPAPVLDLKIDLNAVKNNNDLTVKGRPEKIDDVESEGISIEDDMEAENADEAKNYLKDKINQQIQSKEEEIISRLENRPRMNGVMEVESDTALLGNLSLASLVGRHPRSIDAIDRSITYTEHERTMKQEVDVTYKRAQDIAKAILKTSEAIATSLDLCRKPISTNFISDEPLTEAEDIIDQIVGQLKESLELTMGCRTCVKPHKDLILFLRWLIFDDVSVKLCPSKPKAADLRKNYLLFNHDNMFLGRVCGLNEYPKAPYNCSAAGEVQRGDTDEGKDTKEPKEEKENPAANQNRKNIVSKKRHRTNNG